MDDILNCSNQADFPLLCEPVRGLPCAYICGYTVEGGVESGDPCSPATPIVNNFCNHQSNTENIESNESENKSLLDINQQDLYLSLSSDIDEEFIDFVYNISDEGDYIPSALIEDDVNGRMVNKFIHGKKFYDRSRATNVKKYYSDYRSNYSSFSAHFGEARELLVQTNINTTVIHSFESANQIEIIDYMQNGEGLIGYGIVDGSITYNGTIVENTPGLKIFYFQFDPMSTDLVQFQVSLLPQVNADLAVEFFDCNGDEFFVLIDDHNNQSLYNAMIFDRGNLVQELEIELDSDQVVRDVEIHDGDIHLLITGNGDVKVNKSDVNVQNAGILRWSEGGTTSINLSSDNYRNLAMTFSAHNNMTYVTEENANGDIFMTAYSDNAKTGSNYLGNSRDITVKKLHVCANELIYFGGETQSMGTKQIGSISFVDLNKQYSSRSYISFTAFDDLVL